MSIKANTVSVADVVWATFTGCDGGGPFARVKGGEVVATDDSGAIVFRTASGHIDTIQNWGIYTIHATEAEAWSAAADRLQALADQVINKISHCRTRATGSAQEVATN
jgi:hypothetical protein